MRWELDKLLRDWWGGLFARPSGRTRNFGYCQAWCHLRLLLQPFRLQLGTIPGQGPSDNYFSRGAGGGGEKCTIVKLMSDTDFRKVNPRSAEAQLAPRNEYEQLYLEDFGTGSLRVSVIARGDLVIVGDMCVHQKL
jgi:hypothetical protein